MSRGEEALFGAKSWGPRHPLPVPGWRRACGKLRAVIRSQLLRWKPSVSGLACVPPTPLLPAPLPVAAPTPSARLTVESVAHGRHGRPPDTPTARLPQTPTSGPPLRSPPGLAGLLRDPCSEPPATHCAPGPPLHGDLGVPPAGGPPCSGSAPSVHSTPSRSLGSGSPALGAPAVRPGPLTPVRPPAPPPLGLSRCPAPWGLVSPTQTPIAWFDLG